MEKQRHFSQIRKIKKSNSIIKSILKVYEIYQKKTKDLNAFDFGDLILFCVKLFEEHQDIKEIYKITLNIF